MQKLGQHFLNNQGVVNRIINELSILKGESVIEIGPGTGALTLPLHTACMEAGAELIAIERDNELADRLIQEHPELKLEIVRGDALKAMPSIIARPGFKSGNYKIVGNIPYYITGQLLRVIGELEHKPTRVVIMIQREVAKRLVAKPPEMNLLAAATQIWADTRIISVLKPGDFTPPPKVHSAVVGLNVLHPERAVDTVAYYQTVRVIFKQPRKTILNNIAQAVAKDRKGSVTDLLADLRVKPSARPQDLSITDIIRLSEKLPVLLR